jgi:hypothetical protein
MSLASKVANLFSPGSTNAQPNRNEFGFVDDGLPGGKHTFADVKLGPEGFTSESMVSKKVEEKEHRPYLHVRYPDGGQDLWLIFAVYDCWRAWWNDRGSVDALFRYG